VRRSLRRVSSFFWEGEYLELPINVTVNGTARKLRIDSRTTLVDLIREHLGLTGTHIGCTTGNCGACTVFLNGRTVKSCCVLAADVDGGEVTTIEVLSESGRELHPVQQAFVDHQGLQCGFCTPGMILSTLQLLAENPNPSEDEIRHGIVGNLCRCTGYQFIIDSIRAAAESVRGRPTEIAVRK